MLEGSRNLRPLAAFGLAALLLSGCATSTMTPRFPAARGLPQPDRLVVHDFAVTPADVNLDLSVSSTAPQTEEEIQVGRALAKALSKNLLSELRSRGINALLASEASPLGEATVSIRGQFMRMDPSKRTTQTVVGFGFGGSEVRTHIQVFQGTGLRLTLVGEADLITPSSLKPGIAPGGTVGADANRIAQQLAERVANYYRQEGWIK